MIATTNLRICILFREWKSLVGVGWGYLLLLYELSGESTTSNGNQQWLCLINRFQPLILSDNDILHLHSTSASLNPFEFFIEKRSTLLCLLRLKSNWPFPLCRIDLCQSLNKRSEIASAKPFQMTYNNFKTNISTYLTGSRYALMQAKVTIYYLLLNFKLVPYEKTQVPLKLARTPSGMFADKGIHLKFEPRNVSQN